MKRLPLVFLLLAACPGPDTHQLFIAPDGASMLVLTGDEPDPF